MASTRHDREWISRAASARILQTGTATADLILARAGVAVRQLPGCHVQYYRPDVQRLAAAAITPRRPQPAA